MADRLTGRWTRGWERPFRPDQVERARELIGACPAVRVGTAEERAIAVVLEPTAAAVALLGKLAEGLA